MAWPAGEFQPRTTGEVAVTNGTDPQKPPERLHSAADTRRGHPPINELHMGIGTNSCNRASGWPPELRRAMRFLERGAAW